MWLNWSTFNRKINCNYVIVKLLSHFSLCWKVLASSKYVSVNQFQLVTKISQKFRSFRKYQYQSKVTFPWLRYSKSKLRQKLQLRPSISIVWQNVLKRRGLQNSLHLWKSINSMTRLRNCRSNICVVIQQVGQLPGWSDCCLNVAPAQKWLM